MFTLAYIVNLTTKFQVSTNTTSRIDFTIIAETSGTVDWGDGTTTDYSEGESNISHNYNDYNNNYQITFPNGITEIHHNHNSSVIKDCEQVAFDIKSIDAWKYEPATYQIPYINKQIYEYELASYNIEEPETKTVYVYEPANFLIEHNTEIEETN